eukprot:GHVP01055298.1.p1 GENE.GHVP01055298.1~~GHVP01055298.1.p1  ORF type:complete len:753 (-),score=148.19 GHVP01055298.1:3059-5317(-)
MLVEEALLAFLEFKQSIGWKEIRRMLKAQAALPIHAKRQEIMNAVSNNQVVLIIGNTGCGKSTQIPRYLMEDPKRSPMICTQPRRIAATSLCQRLTEECFSSKSDIGYQVRYSSSRSNNTKMLFCTEGIFLRIFENNKSLEGWSTVIFDEVHERHAQMDIALGALKLLLFSGKRPDLRIILMSATIPAETLIRFFEVPAEAVIHVEGKSFPISIDYRPLPNEPLSTKKILSKKGHKNFDPKPYYQILRHIEEITPLSEIGDVLIFQSGVPEIRRLEQFLKSEFSSSKWFFLPLHSQIHSHETVFCPTPEGKRKCILATNIAETSLTIPNIRYVVDNGYEKEMDVEIHSSIRHLQESWISKSSANQRAGRAGRTGPGICYRLYSEAIYDKFEDHAIPELLRGALENSLLQILNFHNQIKTFPFPDPPKKASLNAALKKLEISNCVVSRVEESTMELTTLGNLFCKLPLSIPESKFLVSSVLCELGALAALICSLSSSQSGMFPTIPRKEIAKHFEDFKDLPFSCWFQADPNDFLSPALWVQLWIFERTDEHKVPTFRGNLRGRTKASYFADKFDLPGSKIYECLKLAYQLIRLVQDQADSSAISMPDQRSSRADLFKSSREIRKRRFKTDNWKSTKEENSTDSSDISVQSSRKFRKARKTHRRDPDEEELNDIELRLFVKSDSLIEDLFRRVKQRDLSLLLDLITLAYYPNVAICDVFNFSLPISQWTFQTTENLYAKLRPDSHTLVNFVTVD